MQIKFHADQNICKIQIYAGFTREFPIFWVLTIFTRDFAGFVTREIPRKYHGIPAIKGGIFQTANPAKKSRDSRGNLRIFGS